MGPLVPKRRPLGDRTAPVPSHAPPLPPATAHQRVGRDVDKVQDPFATVTMSATRVVVGGGGLMGRGGWGRYQAGRGGFFFLGGWVVAVVRQPWVRQQSELLACVGSMSFCY